MAVEFQDRHAEVVQCRSGARGASTDHHLSDHGRMRCAGKTAADVEAIRERDATVPAFLALVGTGVGILGLLLFLPITFPLL